MPSEVILVAAVARNGVIGAEGRLPWQLPEDLARFKALTMGATLVMGRKTYDSIGRPLPGRRTVVVTRQPTWQAEGVTVAHSLDEALAQVEGTAYVVGGGDIYALALPMATRLELTEVDAAPDGDAWFPDWDRRAWVEAAREERDGFAFVTYEPAARGTDPLTRQRPLTRLDQAAARAVERVLPRQQSRASAGLSGAALGVLVGAGALLVATLLLGNLLWLPLAWAGAGAALLVASFAVRILSRRRPAP